VKIRNIKYLKTKYQKMIEMGKKLKSFFQGLKTKRLRAIDLDFDHLAVSNQSTKFHKISTLLLEFGQ
jgi:hypothetical protein